MDDDNSSLFENINSIEPVSCGYISQNTTNIKRQFENLKIKI